MRLRAMQLDAQHLEPWLESGKLDFAMGSFPALTKGCAGSGCGPSAMSASRVTAIRASAARRRSRAFRAEKHVLVSRSAPVTPIAGRTRARRRGRGRQHRLPRPPVHRRGGLAQHSDAVATLPRSVATILADDLGLAIVDPPIRLPRIDIYQYWHDRFHREPGNQWIRSVFAALFSKSPAAATPR